jgi:phosphomannomutase
MDRLATERDNALTRGMDLEAVRGASQQSMASLEQRLLEAERGILERDDRVAVLNAELDARSSAEVAIRRETISTPMIDVDAIVTRAERAEAALAAAVVELTERRELDEMPRTKKRIAAVEKELGHDGRVLVRWSGTEAKLRVMVEGPTPDRISTLANAIAEEARREIGA